MGPGALHLSPQDPISPSPDRGARIKQELVMCQLPCDRQVVPVSGLDGLLNVLKIVDQSLLPCCRVGSEHHAPGATALTADQRIVVQKEIGADLMEKRRLAFWASALICLEELTRPKRDCSMELIWCCEVQSLRYCARLNKYSPSS